jgi:acetolactate synthase-1/2/3 large subunit
LAWGKARIKRYPVLQARHTAPAKLLNPYHFVHTLFESFTKDEVIVCGNATASIVPMQAGRVQKGQRLFANAGSASMGYDLPAAIGAAIARGGKRVICFAGDGSLQLNIQELQTLVHYNLPVKLFVLNNGGYVSIRQSQKNFFGRLIGEGPKSGVTFPDLVKLAAAYGIPALRVDTQDFMSRIAPLLEQPGPVLFDVMLDPEHVFEPKSSSKQLPDGRIVSAPLEDLAPFLDRKELLENLLIPPLDNG